MIGEGHGLVQEGKSRRREGGRNGVSEGEGDKRGY